MSETPASLSWSDTHSYGNGVSVSCWLLCAELFLLTPFGRGQSKTTPYCNNVINWNEHVQARGNFLGFFDH